MGMGMEKEEDGGDGKCTSMPGAKRGKMVSGTITA